MATRKDPQSHLPLKPLHFLLLLSLTDGDRHPYGLKKDIEARAERKLQLGPGTLYRAIQQLEDAGLIEPSGRRPAPDLDDERRRYFRLTALGRAVVTAEARRLASLVRIARAKKLVVGRV
jgi:DNA-binding PadR family transcriptional regulator